MAVYYLVLGLMNDQKAGAVVGKFRVINAAKTLLTKFINIETICFQWMAQGGRWKWFKIATIPGTNFAIRRSIIEQLGGWDDKALAEDTELTIRVYNLGYHIRFFPAAVTWGTGAGNVESLVASADKVGSRQPVCRPEILAQFFKLKRKRIIFDLFYFFLRIFVFFGVIMSNAIFVINLFYNLHLSFGFCLSFYGFWLSFYL